MSACRRIDVQEGLSVYFERLFVEVKTPDDLTELYIYFRWHGCYSLSRECYDAIESSVIQDAFERIVRTN